MTLQAKCVAKERFTKAKEENAAPENPTTKDQSAAVTTSMFTTVRLSRVAVVRFCSVTAIKVVVGIILTIVVHTIVATAAYTSKQPRRTLVVGVMGTTRVLIFAAKET